MVIINSLKETAKKTFNLIKKWYDNKYIQYLITIIEFIIAIGSVAYIMDGNAKGYYGLLIIVLINLYSIWKSRHFLKNMWAYIYYTADKAGRKAHRKRIKEKKNGN